MANFENIIQQLQAERDGLDKAIAALTSLNGSTRTAGHRSSGKRKVSALARRRMAQAQKARWAKVRSESKGTPRLTLVKRTMSASARRKIAAAQRARWAKVKAKKTA
jgi:hypothetical protein